MERLNIPLGTSQHTTRQSWRVVSLVLLCLFVLLMGWRLSILWFTRNTTSRQMPDGTVLAVRFTPTRNEWRELADHLNRTPLISNQSLRLQDLIPISEGELTIFFQADGTRSVAIRTSEDRLPKAWLDAHGVVIQPISSHVYLLSERLQALSPTPFSRFELTRFIPSPHRIGSVYLQTDTWKHGSVLISQKSITLRLPRTDLGRLPWKALPEDTWGAVALPTLARVSLGNLSRSIEMVTKNFDAPSIEEQLGANEPDQGVILLSNDGEGTGFLLLAPAGELSSEEQEALLKTSAALKNPSVQSWKLPDQTQAKEILVDPSLVTIESVVVSGVPVYRATTSNNQAIFSAQYDEKLGISNQEQMIKFWLNKGKNFKHNSCFGNHLWIDLVHTPSSSFSYGARPTFIDYISQNFSKISINSNILSTDIRLCF